MCGQENTISMPHAALVKLLLEPRRLLCFTNENICGKSHGNCRASMLRSLNSVQGKRQCRRLLSVLLRPRCSFSCADVMECLICACSRRTHAFGKSPALPLPSEKVRCAVEGTQIILFRLHLVDITHPSLVSTLLLFVFCERQPDFTTCFHPCRLLAD